MSILYPWTCGYELDLKWTSLERPVLSGRVHYYGTFEIMGIQLGAINLISILLYK